MPISRRQYQRRYLQLVSYLAFTDARAKELLATDRKDDRNLRLVERAEMEEQTDDALAPARGILNGLRISFLLWSVLGLAFFLTS
ncbi:MAG: hypothetical protein Nkreftii_003247 [Candidatus Nitrospira kreftii]|uniref:Uncharacterized protein n=1 Tax=Candidatus Nitrospira kreftii TaxID=2652173 RepID=A0A7S8FGL0_9BACT|nr:MAG: hypothetical protein Nkreftii_003247 [Candidatus Nitrospira kreftii]